MRRRKEGWATAFALLLASPVLSQPGDAIVDSILQKESQATASHLQQSDGCDFRRESDEEIQKFLRELCKDSIEHRRARAQYNKAVHDYNKNMYERHQFWTDWAAKTVYFLTFAGVVLAFMQFLGIPRRIRQQSPVVSGEPSPSGETKPESGTEIGREDLNTGLKIGNLAEINSNVMGLIILIISLAFFFLYLKEVYPIKEPTLTSGQSKAPEAQEDGR